MKLSWKNNLREYIIQMKRSLKIEIDVKFAVVTLVLSALVIFMVYLFASSSVFAEDSGYVGEYVDEFDQAGTVSAPPTIDATTRAPVQAQVFPTVEAAKVGTASDPLITLSYLQNVAVPQLESSILAKIAAGTVSQQSNNPAAAQTSGGSYIVLELSRGQTVVSKTGSLEIIARPGTVASVTSPFGDQGLADLTDGTELLGGQNVPLNHILLVPRNDGRGITVVSLKAYVMVRGDYEIR